MHRCVISHVLTSCARRRIFAHESAALPESEALGYLCEVVLEWSISVFLEVAMLEPSHFPSKIDRNSTFHRLMRRITTGWAPTRYVTSTPARACPMVGSAGCAQLGWGQEGQEYIHSQSINFHFCSNNARSLDSCAPCALSPTHPIHMILRPGHHPCMLWK